MLDDLYMSFYVTEILRTSDEQLLKTEAAIHKSALEFTRGDGVSSERSFKMAGNWRVTSCNGGKEGFQRTSDQSWYWTKRKSS